MKRILLKAALVGGLIGTVGASSASATVYINNRYCGGAQFATCAAVFLDITGTTATVRLWNLSGNTAASWGVVTDPRSVFRAIGIYNTVGVTPVTGTLTTASGAKVGNPASWGVAANPTVGFIVDLGVIAPGGSLNNGLGSGCAAVPSAANLWVSPCDATPGNNPLSDWLTFTFQVNLTAGWDASNAYASIRYGNPGLGGSECWTGPNPSGGAANCYVTTPEPLSMALLATGLVGLGGVGLIRRRRNQNNTNS